MIGWPTVFERFGLALESQFRSQLEDFAEVDNFRIPSVSGLVHLRAENIDGFQAASRDGFSLQFTLAADHVGLQGGGQVLGCDDVRAQVDMQVELERMAGDVRKMRLGDILFACMAGFTLPEGHHVSSSTSCDAFCDMLSAAQWTTYDATMQSFRTSTGDLFTLIDSCPDGAGVGRIPVSAISELRHESDYTGISRATGQLSVFAIISSWNGTPLGAIDYLARVQKADVTNVNLSRCAVLQVLVDAKSLLKAELEKSLRGSLPTALRDGIRSLLTVDATMIGRSYTDSSRPVVSCEPNPENIPPVDEFACSYLSSTESSPYPASDGSSQGRRHACLEWDPSRMELFGALAVALAQTGEGVALDANMQPLRFCHFQFEPERLNLYPNGVEIVVADSQSTDEQSEAMAAGLAPATCGSASMHEISAAPTAADGSEIVLDSTLAPITVNLHP